MHPYIAYLVLTNPANHKARPDEGCPNLRQAIAELWQRWLPGRRKPH